MNKPQTNKRTTFHIATFAKFAKTHKRTLTTILSGLAIVLLLVFPATGWVAASKVLAIQRQIILYDQQVVNISNNNYTFTGGAYDINGVVGGIASDGSYIGLFSAPINSNPVQKMSTRSLISASGALPKVGEHISLQGNIWTSNPKEALGLNYEEHTYQSDIGAMNAWLIPGKNAHIWTIGVHGIGADKNEMLRFIKPVNEAGDTMFVINYRNDQDNPASPDGRNNLGGTEWQDLRSAVAYARSNGAQSIRLYGNSLGGSIVENYLKHASEEDKTTITRVILDSPALNWKSILQNKLEQGGYPKQLYYPTAYALELRANIDVDAISTRPSDIVHKTLIVHSTNDKTVPQAGSREVAVGNPELVRLVDFGDGGHLRSWNYDQFRYESTIKSFLQD